MRFATLKSKVVYVLRRWPALKGHPQGVTLTVWREFYGDRFDGVPDHPVEVSCWKTDASRMIGLPSRDEVARVMRLMDNADRRKELAAMPPAPWYATRD